METPSEILQRLKDEEYIRQYEIWCHWEKVCMSQETFDKFNKLHPYQETASKDGVKDGKMQNKCINGYDCIYKQSVNQKQYCTNPRDCQYKIDMAKKTESHPIHKPIKKIEVTDQQRAIHESLSKFGTTTFIKNDSVNHPNHYTSHPSGIECIEITRNYNFNIGNAIKYLWRQGLKDSNPAIQDLEKAIWYIKDEIKRLSK
jgi:hypothetical protein